MSLAAFFTRDILIRAYACVRARFSDAETIGA